MSARLITKCPECDGLTGDCIDSSLEKDRTEYDGKRCQNCIDRTKRGRRGGINAAAIGTGNGMFINKRKMAVMTGRFAGQHY